MLIAPSFFLKNSISLIIPADGRAEKILYSFYENSPTSASKTYYFLTIPVYNGFDQTKNIYEKKYSFYFAGRCSPGFL